MIFAPSHPRWLYVLPNGDVLVAETNAPPRPDDAKGIKGAFFKYFQAKGGGATPSANRISLLRDADGDGVAALHAVFLDSLTSPFGMALVGDVFYIANTDAVVRFPYMAGQTHIAAPPTKVADLPGGTLNHHWTKSLIANADGSRAVPGRHVRRPARVVESASPQRLQGRVRSVLERDAVWSADRRIDGVRSG